MADVAFFRAPSCSDGESVRQRSVLAGHLKCEQLTARRRFLTSLLALMSAPVWVMAVWPQLLQGPDRRFLLYLFGFLLVLSCWAVLEEWRAANRLQHVLQEATSAADWSGRDTLPDCDFPRLRRDANAAAATPHP